MATALYRMSAAGNAFYLSLDLDPDEGPTIARALADSCDGLILGSHPPAAMRMFNPDGSEAMCGNGLRCLARLLADGGAFPSGGEILTHDGPKRVTYQDDFVEAEMGRARPMPGFPAGPRETEEIVLDGETFQGHAVFVGNPHWVFLADDSLQQRVAELGSRLQDHERFPGGVNVEFAVREGESFRVRVWERGVGETLSCGTGALAVASAGPAAIAPGEIRRIRYPGGELQVRSGEDGRLYLGGEVLREGRFEWNEEGGLGPLQEEKA